MIRPKAKGAPVDVKRMRGWIEAFAGHRQHVGEYAITGWLDQFTSGDDRDLAARVLDVVEYFGQDRIAQSFRRGLGMIDGWHAKKAQREGEWRFVPYSLSGGKSGDSMLYQFRIANSIDDRLIIPPSKLVLEKLGPEDTVVLIDDFVGTGDTVMSSWENFGQLVGTAGKVYLLTVAATHDGQRRVREETGMRVVTAHRLDGSHNILSDESGRFTSAEKDTLLRYNRRIDPALPKGYGECGLVAVFSHRCPNNSLPMLHRCDPNWEGLFPRHD